MVSNMEPNNAMPLYSGATRKQNVACDACRSKKIRCKRMTTAQRCEQCVAKDIECTSNYIEQLQSKPRRPRRFRSSEDKDKQQRWSGDEQSSSSNRMSPQQPARQLSGSGATSVDSHSGPRLGMEDAMAMMSWVTPHSTVFVRPRGSVSREREALQADLLRYLFSPAAVHHHEWRYSDVSALDQARSGACDLWEEQSGAVWDESPSSAHLNLWAAGEAELERVAQDLIETFFQIVHSRLSILDEGSFKAKYNDARGEGVGPLSHALLAVVLAFGARFSEHATLLADREEISARDGESGAGRSRMMQLLVIRAREVLEVNKAFRVANLANAQALLILEGMAGQSVMQRKEYRASYLSLAARHLEQLRDPILHIMPTNDEKMRTHLAMYVIANFETAFFRLRPDLNVGDVGVLPASGNMGSDDEVWLMAARSGAGICSKYCSDLWQPRTSANGIPLNTLRDFVHDHSSWRDLYLNKLGLPVPWPEHWAALTTVKIMSTDIFYHALWIVVERAVHDFGIQEGPEDSMRGMLGFEVSQIRDRLKREAMHSAMRIAMLSALATEQGYLRVDPLVLYRPIYDAGMYLARLGREDCLGCVAGLKLYSVSYPQMWDLAVDIENQFLKSSQVVSSGNPSGNPAIPATQGGVMM